MLLAVLIWYCQISRDSGDWERNIFNIVMILALSYVTTIITTLLRGVFLQFAYWIIRPIRPHCKTKRKHHHSKCYYSPVQHPVTGNKRTKGARRSDILRVLARKFTKQKCGTEPSERLGIPKNTKFCIPAQDLCLEVGVPVLPYKYDTDSIYVGVDTFSTYCITNNMRDYVDVP
jgi:hypothetical protein